MKSIDRFISFTLLFFLFVIVYIASKNIPFSVSAAVVPLLVLSVVVAISIFHGDSVEKDKWSYRFLQFTLPGEKATETRVNLCDIFPLTVLTIFIVAIGIVVIVVGTIIGFFFAVMVNIKEIGGDKSNFLVPFERWPKLFGYRIMPIVVIIVGVVLYGLWSLVLYIINSSIPLTIEGVFVYLWPVLLGLALGTFFVFMFRLYFRSSKWQTTKQSIKKVIRAVKYKICLIQPVVED